MSRYNLLDEEWISVIDKNGEQQNVSLKKIFSDSHNFYDLAGDTKTQDFAVLRVLLAVLHTVFSRFDANGNKYAYVELDEIFNQLEKVNEFDLEDYCEELTKTWFELWKRKAFPNIVDDYLEKWRDRFYLFDEKMPFFQVTAEDVSDGKIKNQLGGKGITSAYGKYINRLISESGNKIALFSPKNEETKGVLKPDEIARWLITFQGYTGLADKTFFVCETNHKFSKGWLFDLGGVYLKGKNLFETLMINLTLFSNDQDNFYSISKPCWEMTSSEQIKFYLDGGAFDNRAGLYTAWSRGIYIDHELDCNEPFSCDIVKLPEINHIDNFLEPMTLWKLNETGENKGHYTPKKHIANQSLWRSFPLIAINKLDSGNSVKGTCIPPGVISWFSQLKTEAEKYGLCNENFVSSLVSVSMQEGGSPTSQIPVDEIVDSMPLRDFILVNFNNKNWATWIRLTIEKTKNIVESIYKDYLKDVKSIRNIKSDRFIDNKIEEIYFILDKKFREWLVELEENKSHEEQIAKWEANVKLLVEGESTKIFYEGSNRDFMGINNKSEDKSKKNNQNYDAGIKTIAHVYNKFKQRIKKITV